MAGAMLSQSSIQAQLDHNKEFPEHKDFKTVGNMKKEKIEGVICLTCKKFITGLKLRSSKKRRR